jgi:hypothetical protein
VSPARVLATIGVACACAAQSPAPALTGEQVLARAKAVFRSHSRPPFVAYTLIRRDWHNAQPDFADSYTLKIWCRTADRSALTRRAWKGKAYGSLQNITVAFDEMVDPGPPTADVFEPAVYGPKPAELTPQPDASQLPVIGAVSVSTDYDYRVTALKPEGTAWHLMLKPKRDPQRNRIDDLWVDATTFEILRMRVRDHLYFGFRGSSIEEELDARFTLRDGLPLLSAIRGRTLYEQYESEFTYRDVSFPASLPDWYFEPQSYGAHRADAPA